VFTPGQVLHGRIGAGARPEDGQAPRSHVRLPITVTFFRNYVLLFTIRVVSLSFTTEVY
jgi:hypothetical protein